MKNFISRWLVAAWPQDCLLCGSSAHELLCAQCAASLPQLAVQGLCCPVCATPTGTAMPCGACLKQPPAFDATLALWRYHFPIDQLIVQFKFAHRLALAHWFAERLLAGTHPVGDVLLPMPLAPARLRERGFNQALEISRRLSRALDIPLSVHDCQRVRHTVAQSRLPWPARARNVRHAFECSADFSGRSVIVVDDVLTTGATANELAATLKAHGARRVSNWVLARAVRQLH